MQDTDFPVLYGKRSNFPSLNEPLCPVCRKKEVWGSNEYVELSGGAFEVSGKALSSDLWLDWWASKLGDTQEQVEVALACEVANSRYQLAFCSTKCLRVFFNQAVDSLEEKISEYKNS